jgi:cell division protein FtsB
VTRDDIQPQSKRRPPVPAQPGRTRRIVQLVLLFIAVVIIVDTLVGDRGLLATLRARREYDELTLALARQRAENARLWEEVRRLNEDPSAVEEIARRELGLIKPGEKLFIVKDVPLPSSRDRPSTSQGVAPAASSNPSAR